MGYSPWYHKELDTTECLSKGTDFLNEEFQLLRTAARPQERPTGPDWDPGDRDGKQGLRLSPGRCAFDGGRPPIPDLDSQDAGQV